MNLPRVVALSRGDAAESDFPALERAIGRALDAGLPGLLLREPRLEDGAFLRLGARLARLFETTSRPWFAVHDRAHLAAELGADAVHTGFRSLTPSTLRARFGHAFGYGRSTHAGDAPETWDGADYVFHGPLRTPRSKPEGTPGHRAAVGVQGVARMVELARSTPVVVLGGVAPADVVELLGPTVGAHGVAVLSGILGADDPGAATRSYLDAVASVAHSTIPAREHEPNAGGGE